MLEKTILHIELSDSFRTHAPSVWRRMTFQVLYNNFLKVIQCHEIQENPRNHNIENARASVSFTWNSSSFFKTDASSVWRHTEKPSLCHSTDGDINHVFIRVIGWWLGSNLRCSIWQNCIIIFVGNHLNYKLRLPFSTGCIENGHHKNVLCWDWKMFI